MSKIVIDLEKAAYKLQGRMDFQGLKISIENRKGSVRRGVDKDGHVWATKMKHAYGYIRLSDGVKRKGSDGDHVDCFIGPNKASEKVYIVHLNHADTGKFDEDKCFLGFGSKKEAKAAFDSNYDAAGRRLYGGMLEMDMTIFKQRLSVQSKGIIKSMLNVVFCDLVKGHVKAHFRKDKNGKLVFVHEHQLKDGLGHDWEIANGHKVKINNPKSKHHGKVGTVTSYSEKYNEVGVKFGIGGVGLHKPDHLEHHTPLHSFMMGGDPATDQLAKPVEMLLSHYEVLRSLVGKMDIAPRLSHVIKLK